MLFACLTVCLPTACAGLVLVGDITSCLKMQRTLASDGSWLHAGACSDLSSRLLSQVPLGTADKARFCWDPAPPDFACNLYS
jgi:hypothetical protein